MTLWKIGEKTDESRFFRFWRAQLKTRIYVDGFNFYYGRLKRTPYKWLDVVTLFAEHAIPSEVNYSSCHIKYFTAIISGKAASNEDSLKDQNNYLSALKAHYSPDSLSIYLGSFHVTESVALHIPDPSNAPSPRDCDRISVWKMEEKESDVSMAVEAVADTLTEADLKQIVFVTNDSDQAPTLAKIRVLRPDIKIGVICPIKKDKGRAPSVELVKHADWSIRDLRDSWLKRSQLPRIISKTYAGNPLKKPRVKPEAWFGQANIVSEIIEILLPYCNGKRGRCWKMLETPVPSRYEEESFEKLPIDMLDTEEEARKVLSFVKQFVSAQTIK